MSRMKGRSVTTNVTLTPPSKSSTRICTSSKNPSAKMARTSCVRNVGLNGAPIFVWTAPSTTASCTRRVPSTTSSLTRTGAGADDGACAAATAAPTISSRATARAPTGRRTDREAVTECSGSGGPRLSSRTQSRELSVLRELERRLDGLRFAEHEALGTQVDLDAGALRKLTADDRLGERILDVLLNRAPELARAVRRVVALVYEGRLRRRREQELDASLGELLVDARHHQP